ncbi:MAG: PDZ domain-containing protein [Gammaproteobacteria bacterium]|nr:PDZ domain-containing protein [Gammaproteobacteria bacterium]
MKMINILIVCALAFGAHAHDEDEIRAKIDAARERLDQAAREFAELHSSMRLPDFDVALRPGNRPFIGLLIRGGDEQGIHVGGVTPDGGAAQGGVEAGDTVTAINGISLLGLERPFETLSEVLDGVEPGDTLRLDVIREDDFLILDIIAQAHPRALFLGSQTILSAPAGVPHLWREQHDGQGVDYSIAGPMPVMGRMASPVTSQLTVNGLQLLDVGEELGDYFGVAGGVLIVAVPQDSELRPGDILLSVNDVDVASMQEAYAALMRLEETGEASVFRKYGDQTVAIAPIARSGSGIHLETRAP